jgi:hypothetical protein
MMPRSLARDLARALNSPIDTSPHAPLTVFTLLCRRHVPMYVCAIKSLLKLIGLPCAVTAIDDGTLGHDERALLESEIRHIAILPAPIAKTLQGPWRTRWCARFIRDNVFAKRLFGISAYDGANAIVLLDADVLFFAPPSRIRQWAERGERVTLYNRDAHPTACLALPDENLHSLGVGRIPSFNCGLVCTYREILAADRVDRGIRALYRSAAPSRWVWEQTVWAICAGTGPVEALGPEYCFVNDLNLASRPMPHQLVSCHYSGAARRAFFTEGVRYLARRNVL